jgi:hypothetical protein
MTLKVHCPRWACSLPVEGFVERFCGKRSVFCLAEMLAVSAEKMVFNFGGLCDGESGTLFLQANGSTEGYLYEGKASRRSGLRAGELAKHFSLVASAHWSRSRAAFAPMLSLIAIASALSDWCCSRSLYARRDMSRSTRREARSAAIVVQTPAGRIICSVSCPCRFVIWWDISRCVCSWVRTCWKIRCRVWASCSWGEIGRRAV